MLYAIEVCFVTWESVCKGVVDICVNLSGLVYLYHCLLWGIGLNELSSFHCRPRASHIALETLSKIFLAGVPQVLYFSQKEPLEFSL